MLKLLILKNARVIKDIVIQLSHPQLSLKIVKRKKWFKHNEILKQETKYLAFLNLHLKI